MFNKYNIQTIEPFHAISNQISHVTSASDKIPPEQPDLPRWYTGYLKIDTTH